MKLEIIFVPHIFKHYISSGTMKNLTKNQTTNYGMDSGITQYVTAITSPWQHCCCMHCSYLLKCSYMK